MKVLLAFLLVGINFFPTLAQPFNQKIPFEVCDLIYDTTSCFAANESVDIVVGEHVTKLDESFRFCLDSTVFSGTRPIKVIIAIDRSGSMGDNDPQNMRTEAAHNFVEKLRALSPESYVGSLVFSEGVSARSIYGPIKLKNQAQYDTLWDRIESGSRNPQYRLSKILATNQGIAFSTAINMMVNIKDIASDLKQHIIMITDDGWFEVNDIMPEPLLNASRPRFPDNAFPKIHTVVLTGSGNPQGDKVRGLANIQMIADKTGGLYIENATPATIVSRLSEILVTLTPRMDKLKGVTMTNVTTGESHVMSFDSIPGSTNDFIIKGASWDLANGNNVFVFKKTIQMRDSTENVAYDTIQLTRSDKTIADVLSVGSFLDCATEWPGVSFTAIPESLLVNETINSKVQIEPSFIFPYALSDVSIKGFTTSNPDDASILSLFKLDSNIINTKASGEPGNGTPNFNKSTGAFGGSMTDGYFSTTVSIPTEDFSFDFWVKSDGNSEKTVISSDKFSLSVNQSGEVTFKSGSVSLKSTAKIYSGVWTNIAVARTVGSVSIFINGLNSSKAEIVTFSGDQTVTIAAGSGFNIDELRFNSKANVRAGLFGQQLYAVAQVTGMNWTLGSESVKDNAVDIPTSTWNNNAVNFSITRSSAAQVILNMTRLDERNSWTVNSNPIEFVNPFPDPSPVVAELIDQNGNGFIDHIRFVVQDTSIVAQRMPSTGDYFKTLNITTYDDKDIAFRPDVIERIDDKTFILKLIENNGSSFETGWKSAEILTNDVTIMASGAYTDIVSVSDKAGPIIARAQFEYGEEGKKEDIIRIQFSEPISLVNNGGSVPDQMINYYQRKNLSAIALQGIAAGSFKLEDNKMNATIVMTNGFFVIPTYDSLQLKNAPEHLVDQSGNSAHSRSRITVIEGKVKLVIVLVPSQNPYVPGTEVSEKVRDYYLKVLEHSGNNVLLVAIKSTLPLDALPNGSFGEVVIYDAVGNIVKRDLRVYAGQSETDYAFTWDATNLNQRVVNRGVYLAVVKVNDFFGTIHVFREKLGIK